MEKSVTITWNETEILEVSGTYTKARAMSNDRINPPEDSDFEIRKIQYKGQDVSLLFDDTMYYQIQDKCLMLLDN